MLHSTRCLLPNGLLDASVAGQSLCISTCIIGSVFNMACMRDRLPNALPGMQVDGLRCDMAVQGDVAALEDFSREALGTVYLWCGPCETKSLRCASAPCTAASIAD